MFAGAACLVATIPGQAGAGSNPPGNNGTVKVDGVEFDVHPDNEPHVGCTFQIDWYGFDSGAESDVTFEVWPPSGKMVTILEDHVPLDGDDNAGGGSEDGLDAEKEYDLSALLQDFEQHPNQGWHVKLTINVTGSQGADVKHKVFWVTGCETPPTTSSSTTSSSTTSTSEVPSSSTSSSTTSTSEVPSSSTSSSTTSTSEVPSSSTSSSTTSTSEAPSSSSSETTSTLAPSSTTSSTMVAAGGQLPETGGDSQALLIAAGIIMLLGGGALLGSAKLSGRQTA
jgi:LPXTG-motif cell wall-anchored protein